LKLLIEHKVDDALFKRTALAQW